MSQDQGHLFTVRVMLANIQCTSQAECQSEEQEVSKDENADLGQGAIVHICSMGDLCS